MFSTVHAPVLPNGVGSRSINAENPTGAPGESARAASALGPGRKGRLPPVAPGETLTLADIDGPGMIRHIWMTVPDRTAAGPWVLRDLVLRTYWDDDETPRSRCRSATSSATGSARARSSPRTRSWSHRPAA